MTPTSYRNSSDEFFQPKLLTGEKSLPNIDGVIAATALEHDLTLVTRNVKDFGGLGLTLLNPWET